MFRLISDMMWEVFKTEGLNNIWFGEFYGVDQETISLLLTLQETRHVFMVVQIKDLLLDVNMLKKSPH